MKKFFLMIAILIPFLAAAQVSITRVIQVPTKTTLIPWQVGLKTGDVVVTVDSGFFYSIKAAVPYSTTKTTLLLQIRSSNALPLFSTTNATTLYAKGPGYYVDTAQAQVIRGAKNFVNNAIFRGTVTVNGQSLTADHVNDLKAGNSLSATDTLFGPIIDASSKFILASQILTQNHVNNVLFNNSVTATDTAFAPVVDGTTKVISPLVTATQVSSTGSLLADTAHFGTDATGARNKYIRKKITGITTTDVFTISQINSATAGLAGNETLSWYIPSADSLVIARSAATTSGLAVSFIRIKK